MDRVDKAKDNSTMMAYLEEHMVEPNLNRMVNELAHAKPADPYGAAAPPSPSSTSPVLPPSWLPSLPSLMRAQQQSIAKKLPPAFPPFRRASSSFLAPPPPLLLKGVSPVEPGFMMNFLKHDRDIDLRLACRRKFPALPGQRGEPVRGPRNRFRPA